MHKLFKMLGIRNLRRFPHHYTKLNSSITYSSNLSAWKLSNQNVICHVKNIPKPVSAYRFSTQSTTNYNDTTTKSSSSPTTNSTSNNGEPDTLTEYHAYDMIHKLSDDERISLSKALSKFESDKIKSKFQGKLIDVPCNTQKF